MLMHIPLPQTLVAAVLLFCNVLTSAQSKPISFDFFPQDSNMGRTDLTHDQTRSASPKLIKRGKRFYQVIINRHTGHELFRVLVGTDEATWWVYGLVQEADINGDGIPDFCWHGGDDTSALNLLVLSSSSGYRKVNVNETLQREWKRRFPSERLESAEGTDEPDASELKVVRASKRVTLQAVVTSTFFDQKSDGTKTFAHRLRVPEARFVYMK